ncbi:hypothetical protein JCM5353_008144 [Sporobolomyces roseus]
MELDPTSQAQLTAFLLSQSQPQGIAQHESFPPPPFDWNGLEGSTGEMGTEELDNWLKQQMDALTQLPLPLQTIPSLPVYEEKRIPAQPDAFPPISNNRFHPYDRQSKSTPTSNSNSQDRIPGKWQSQQLQQMPLQAPQAIYQPPLPPPRAMRRQPVLYPPSNQSHPLILSSPTPHPHPSPNLQTHLPTPPSPAQARPVSKEPRIPTRRRRTRSLPPSFPTLTSPRSRSQDLDQLISYLDSRHLSLGGLLSGLNDSVPSSKMKEFLDLSSSPEEGSLEARLKAWRSERGIEEEVKKGMEEIVKEWEGIREGFRERERRKKGEEGMEDAVRELRLGVGEKKGSVTGVVIRSVINRYHESYAQSTSDLLRLDAALSRPPSPNLASAPREPTAWSGTLILSSLQADLLSHWLMAEGRPDLQEERNKGGIETEHMRIYSSLSPLELHSRGAEICRALLKRDPSLTLYHPHFNQFHSFVEGPQLALIDQCGFFNEGVYDDYSLWHHALMCYLQLCVRYPEFRESKNAEIYVAPDLPPPLNPTALERQLIDRLLKNHWDYLRLYLLNEHGGLLRSAVRGFEGVKLNRFDLLSVVSDTIEVIEALKKSASSTTDRILPYDASVSQVRNEWRQRAFWDSQSHWVVWSAATTHFLELSSVEKSWGRGVGRELPGLEEVLRH